MSNFNCRDHDLVKCFAIDCLLISACVRQLTISNAYPVCKLRVYCRNSVTWLWYFAVNSLWRNQHSALLDLRATFRKSNALCRIWTLYAFERCAVTEYRALCLLMDALCHIAGIGCIITEMRADCLYLAGKRYSEQLRHSAQLNGNSASISSHKRWYSL